MTGTTFLRSAAPQVTTGRGTFTPTTALPPNVMPAAVAPPAVEALPIGAKTVTVATGAQLVTAARGAKAGDTILLAPGNFGDVSLSNINPTGTITIRSANPDNDAVIRSLSMFRSSNIVIEDVDFHRPIAAGASKNSYIVNVGAARNVTFVGIDVMGSMNNSAHDDGSGMSLQGKDISVLDSRFTQLKAAAAMQGEDFLFAGNTITQVRQGLSIRSMNRAVIEGNFFNDFQADYSTTEHPDSIQVHSGGTANASHNLIIRNNVLTPSANGPVGGIYIQSEAVFRGKRVDERHTNILIENNYYEGNYRHAITVNNADDITVRNNTVRAGTNQGLVPAINLGDIRGGLVEDNVATMILQSRSFKNTDMVFRDNVNVWDVKDKRGVADGSLFVEPGDGDIDFNDLSVVATSAAGQAGAGFRAVADIGNLSGTAAAQMAAWLPGFDANFAVFA